MKALIIPFAMILLAILLVIGCGDHEAENSTAVYNIGTIVRIEKWDTTYIWVEWQAPNQRSFIMDMYGSDTCHIGQLVHLSPLPKLK